MIKVNIFDESVTVALEILVQSLCIISLDLDAVLFNSVVKVTVPLNKKVVTLVNRMIEFVVKEGPLFEAMIMNNELNNPDYNFLFDNKSPTHVYYRLVCG